MPKLNGGVALLTAAMVLTACSGEMMRNEVERPGVPTVFAYAASKGEVATEIVGNPFSASQDAVDDSVLRVVEASHNGPQTRFSTHPGPDAAKNFRLVVVFNPAERASAHFDVCKSPASAGAGGERLDMVMALCGNDTVYSWAQSSMPRQPLAGPEDPAFKAMVARAALALIPMRDPYVDSQKDNCTRTNCS